MGRVVDLLEDVADHAGDHAALGLIRDVGSEHRVRLSAASLAIGEHCAVESLHDSQDDGLDSLFIDKSLRCIRVKHLIVVELVCAPIACRVCPVDLHRVLADKAESLAHVSPKSAEKPN